jgi:regulator of sirC expression with transglutaminase-like and TPR domain
MAITPSNLDALMSLLNEPDASLADTLISQLSAMPPDDLELVVSRCERAETTVRRNVESALIRARYAALDPKWSRLCTTSVDLERALCMLAQTAEQIPEINVSHRLDELAGEIGERLLGDRAFDLGLGAFAEILYRKHHLRGNSSDYYAPENSYISHVLATGLGIPISLCSVAILIARRLELPVSGIGTPGHFLGFYGDVDLKIGSFFDPFDGFRRLNAGELRALLAQFVDTVEPPMLRPVRDREIVSRTIRNMIGCFAHKGNLEHIRNLERWARQVEG